MGNRDATVVVHRARAADVNDLLQLRRALFASGEAHWSHGVGDEWETTYRNQLTAEFSQRDEATRQATFLASVNGTAVGTLTAIIDCHLANPANPVGHVGWIQGVYVQDTARGCSAGTLLTTTAESWLAKHGVFEVYLDSTSEALTMYTRHGYVINDEPHLRKELQQHES